MWFAACWREDWNCPAEKFAFDSDYKMAALFAEMNSFVTKLTQLNSYGLNACLNFNAYGGRVYVSLHAELGGDLETEDYTQARKMPKPSRLRRWLRRRQAQILHFMWWNFSVEMEFGGSGCCCNFCGNTFKWGEGWRFIMFCAFPMQLLKILHFMWWNFLVEMRFWGSGWRFITFYTMSIESFSRWLIVIRPNLSVIT